MSKIRIYKTLRRNMKCEQELWAAICSLASNSDNIKKRLERAYKYHITYLEPENIPQDYNRKKLIKIKSKLTRLLQNSRGRDGARPSSLQNLPFSRPFGGPRSVVAAFAVSFAIGSY